MRRVRMAGHQAAARCGKDGRAADPRDGGEVRILGLDPLADRHRLHQRIGVQLPRP